MIRKGNTPAGMHISIMVKEILDFLDIQPGQTGFDATLGYGGHTKAMLECLKGAYLCYRCRPGGIGKDEETTGRAGIRRGNPDGLPSEFLHD